MEHEKALQGLHLTIEDISGNDDQNLYRIDFDHNSHHISAFLVVDHEGRCGYYILGDDPIKLILTTTKPEGALTGAFDLLIDTVMQAQAAEEADTVAKQNVENAKQRSIQALRDAVDGLPNA